MSMSEEEMKAMLAQIKSANPGMPESMRLTVRYNKELQKITNCTEEPIFMGVGGTFYYLLMNVFMSHPEIEQQYPPGVLLFNVNGCPPKLHSPLFDGDIIEFGVLGGEV